jgi:hypothetical protein
VQTFVRKVRAESCVRTMTKGSIPMLDVILLAIALGFFALSVGYAYACERL